MATVDLLCAEQVIRIDASICHMASERVHWKSFLASSSQQPSLDVRRHATLDGKVIDAPLGRCSFRLAPDGLDVCVEDGVFRGELVLRLAWYIVATRQGGVLIHGCALKKGKLGVVAAGKSGDGKSTLARLGVEAELELLTDEVVILFPDGRVSGTPFRSDFENAGQPGLVQCAYFFALEKALGEELRPLSPLSAVQLALSQCFDVPEVALPRTEVRRRLLQFLSHVQLRTLAFRKDPLAGQFVSRELEIGKWAPLPDPLPPWGEGI